MPISSTARNLYELIDRQSPSKASFQIDGGSATMDFIIDRANLGNMVSDILGSVEKTGEVSGRLKRRLPAAHPYYNWLYATKINDITGLKPYGRQLGESYQVEPELNHIYDFTTYEKYKVQVQFEPRPYLMMDDEELKGKERTVRWYYDVDLNFVDFQDPMEYLRFVDIETKPQAEFLSSPVGQFVFKTQSGGGVNDVSVTNQNGGGVNMIIVKSEVRFTWFFVPYEIAFSENISDAFGKVNQYDFFGYPKGTLLMVGAETKRYPPPEQLQRLDPAFNTSVSQKLCDITLVCSAFIQPSRDLSTDIPASDAFKIKDGHNLLPAAGTLKYNYVESVSSVSGATKRPIYDSYPFERMFRLT